MVTEIYRRGQEVDCCTVWTESEHRPRMTDYTATNQTTRSTHRPLTNHNTEH